MPRKIGNIELYMGPEEVGGPDNLKKAIIDFIDGANKKLDIAVQELDSFEIADSILRARARGVRVRIVLEADYLRSKKRRANPIEPGGPLENNRLIQDAILRAAIRINSDFNPKIFHQKFIIRDSKDLLTGSTNFTETGVSTNLNHIAIIKNKKVALIYTREFKEIKQGHFGKLNEGHDQAPTDLTISKIPIRVLFAPDHNPEMEIMKQMAKAIRRIDFAIFTFSKSSGIDDQMIAMKNAGVAVRGAMDSKQANQKWAATRTVKNAGAALYKVGPKGALRKLHHKLMVIDKQVVIIGSFNYTGPANATNDENIIIMGNLKKRSGPAANEQKKLARYALKEIDRIIEKYGKRL